MKVGVSLCLPIYNQIGLLNILRGEQIVIIRVFFFSVFTCASVAKNDENKLYVCVPLDDVNKWYGRFFALSCSLSRKSKCKNNFRSEKYLRIFFIRKWIQIISSEERRVFSEKWPWIEAKVFFLGHTYKIFRFCAILVEIKLDLRNVSFIHSVCNFPRMWD